MLLVVQDKYKLWVREFEGFFYIKCTIINYQFKTSELKNVEKLVKQTVQALKPY